MFLVCQNNKYVFCYYGRRCEKINLTEICKVNENYKETFWCDKRHPYRCSYFEIYGRCRFGTFCAYIHVEDKEMLLRKESNKLKGDIVYFKTGNKEVMNERGESWYRILGI